MRHTFPRKQPQFKNSYVQLNGADKYLEPGKRGRSEKSSAIIAPIAHMSENEMRNKHINKMIPIYFLDFVVNARTFSTYQLLHYKQ